MPLASNPWPWGQKAHRNPQESVGKQQGADCQPDIGSGVGSIIRAYLFTETRHEEITPENMNKMELVSLPLNC